MCVDSVVYQRPAHSACVERDRNGPVDRPSNGGPAEQCAPVERKTEHGLRPVCVTLHEWVQRHYWERGSSEKDAKGRVSLVILTRLCASVVSAPVPIELREDREASTQLSCKEP